MTLKGQIKREHPYEANGIHNEHFTLPDGYYSSELCKIKFYLKNVLHLYSENIM